MRFTAKAGPRTRTKKQGRMRASDPPPRERRTASTQNHSAEKRPTRRKLVAARPSNRGRLHLRWDRLSSLSSSMENLRGAISLHPPPAKPDDTQSASSSPPVLFERQDRSGGPRPPSHRSDSVLQGSFWVSRSTELVTANTRQRLWSNSVVRDSDSPLNLNRLRRVGGEVIASRRAKPAGYRVSAPVAGSR